MTQTVFSSAAGSVGAGAHPTVANHSEKPSKKAIFATRIALSGVAALVASGALAANPGRAYADEPQVHISSAQDLCNQIWPGSEAMPDPAKFGAVCVRHDGVLMRLSRALPNLVSDTFALEPGKAVVLPVGSVRVEQANPLSDWVIPD
ncbi:hypothetical protein BOO86_15415 [Mycobacterium sp. CBMA 234]|nr:hypothetical protein [Mycolicibacterium sp. CBMA 234]